MTINLNLTLNHTVALTRNLSLRIVSPAPLQGDRPVVRDSQCSGSRVEGAVAARNTRIRLPTLLLPKKTTTTNM